MTKVDKKAKRALRVRPASYEVGYGRPPVATRFVKGQSGNPRGRPKGARNKLPALNEERLKAIVLAEAYRDIKVNDGDRQVTLSMAQAIIRALALAAAKGQARAQSLFTRLLSVVEQQNRQLHDDWLEAAIKYKDEWEKELRRRERLGVTGPEPLPHPDHVIIDRTTGSVRIVGPMTSEEKAIWDAWQERAYEESVDQLERLIEYRAGSSR